MILKKKKKIMAKYETERLLSVDSESELTSLKGNGVCLLRILFEIVFCLSLPA